MSEVTYIAPGTNLPSLPGTAAASLLRTPYSEISLFLLRGRNKEARRE